MVTVVDSLVNPQSMAFPRSGDMLVTERRNDCAPEDLPLQANAHFHAYAYANAHAGHTCNAAPIVSDRGRETIQVNRCPVTDRGTRGDTACCLGR